MENLHFIIGYSIVGLIAIEAIIMMVSGKMVAQAFVLGWRNKYTPEAINQFSRKAGFPLFLVCIGALIMMLTFDIKFVLWMFGVGFAVFIIGVIFYIYCNKKYLKGNRIE